MAPQAVCPDENVKNWNKIVFMIALLPIILEALSLIGTLLVGGLSLVNWMYERKKHS